MWNEQFHGTEKYEHACNIDDPKKEANKTMNVQRRAQIFNSERNMLKETHKKVQICCSAAQNINAPVKISTNLGKSAARKKNNSVP